MTYCLCTCPDCGEKFHEWIDFCLSASAIAVCWCPACKSLVEARVIPCDLRYEW